MDQVAKFYNKIFIVKYRLYIYYASV